MNHEDPLAAQLVSLLSNAGKLLVTAESCTGGLVAKLVTDIAGSSSALERGFVTYSNDAKEEMLGVSSSTLETHGAVSEATVIEMAEGALANSRADLSVAISGIAGPGGATAEKPLGLVWFAWGQKSHSTVSESRIFTGDRDAVRQQAAGLALSHLISELENSTTIS